MVKVAVVGAGIIGLSSAVCIQKINSSISVTIISDQFSPNTTGDGAAGIWGPYLLGNTPPEKIAKWSQAAHDLFRDLWNSDKGGLMGISMIPCRRVTTEKDLPDPSWKDVTFGFRRMSKKELSSLNIPNLTHGNEHVTFACEASKLLPYFLGQFKENGGTVLKQHVSDLNKLKDDYDIVVNCTGLNAHHVVPDPSVAPKRGQVIRVESPESCHVYIDESDEGNYIIPNQESVILGGTHQEGDWNTTPYEKDTLFIKNGCFKIQPSLKHARIIREWVGLRPGRPSVRLELEVRKNGQKPFYVVHNYGHGGSGITLSWGCALEAAELVQKAIAMSLPSKL